MVRQGYFLTLNGQMLKENFWQQLLSFLLLLYDYGGVFFVFTRIFTATIWLRNSDEEKCWQSLNEVFNKQADKVIIVDPGIFREDLESFMSFDSTLVAFKCSSRVMYLLILMNKFCMTMCLNTTTTLACCEAHRPFHKSYLDCTFFCATTRSAKQWNIDLWLKLH